MRNGKNYVPLLPILGAGKWNMLVRTVGYILRCVLAFLCSYGCVRTVFTSIGAPLAAEVLPLACFCFCLMMSLCSLSKRAAAAGVMAVILSISAFFAHTGRVLETVYAMVGAVKKAWCVRLDSLGYAATSDDGELARLLGEIGRTETEAYTYAAVFLTLIACAAVCALTLRRVRPVLLAASVLAATAYFLLYGACEDNLGPALILVCIAAFAAIFFYEGNFVNKRTLKGMLHTNEASYESRRELSRTVCYLSQLGGYYGAAAAVIAAVIITVPFRLDRPMTDIPAVSGTVNRMADVASAMMDGYIPDSTGLVYIGSGELKARGTGIADRAPGKNTVMTVSADLDVPIYLRSWTGVDYRNDSWHSVSYSRMSDYRSLFGEGFSAEWLTGELLYAIDPTLTTMHKGVAYTAFEDFGYVIAPVHLRFNGKTDSQLYLPSYTDPGVNLLGYGTDSAQRVQYSPYYEGIFMLNGTPTDDGYSVRSFVTLPADAEVLTNVAQLIRHYSIQRDIVSAVRKLIEAGADSEALDGEYLKISADSEREIKTLSGEYSFPTSDKSLAHRYTYIMTDDERTRVNRLMDSLEHYNNYVYSNYTSVCENYEAFDALADRIVEESGMTAEYTYPGRHRTVETVIDYLSRNMTYTLTPAKPSEDREYYNSADTFLFDTAEGYCVQYATSAVMLLRCLGIPARYAVGYIADGFEPSPQGGAGIYTAEVTDEKAHAWIEVYYDFFGWVRYEATAPFNREEPISVPAPESITVPDSPSDPAPSANDISQTEPSEEKPTVDTEKSDTAKNIITSVGCAMAVICVITAAAAISAMAVRGHRAEQRLRDAILEAKEKGHSQSRQTELARTLGEYVLMLLEMHGFTPVNGERPTDFYERVNKERAFGGDVDISAVGSIIEACEFGGLSDGDGLVMLSECAERLYGAVRVRKGLIRALYVKYFALES